MKNVQEWSTSRLNEACGIFGLHKVEDAGTLCYYGLHSLQHRGQEAAGISASSGEQIRTIKGKGLVTEVFDSEKMAKLEGAFQAVGHNRYCNAQQNIIENVQPIMVRSHQGDFALVNNGQIVNARQLREGLEREGAIFQGTDDTEIIAHLIQRAEGSFLEKVKTAAQQLEGAFALIVMTKNTMYALRDRHGLKPMVLGRLEEGYVISSESCAFEIVNAHFLRDIAPGEIIKLGKQGFVKDSFAAPGRRALCAMEYVYFSRPDSDLDGGRNVHTARKLSGALIAKKDPCEADLVIGVPDSSLSAAMGYAEERKLPYEMGLIKNRYIGRTFIRPSQKERDRGVKMKLSAVASIVQGKRCVVVDDSIVRGTTARLIVRLIKEAGAKEVHLRIASPPLLHPCQYGVDFKSHAELISVQKQGDALRQWLGCDSLQFLAYEDLASAFGKDLCTACFDGRLVHEEGACPRAILLQLAK